MDLHPDESLLEFAQRARSVARRPSLDAAAAEALHALRAAEVDALLLKGVALARSLYSEDEPRGYSDIDVLVAPEDIALAGQTLAGLGYVDFLQVTGLKPFEEDPHSVLWTRTSKAHGPIAIDLHWRLPGCAAGPGAVWDALRTRWAWLELDGLRCPVLNRAGLALHLALHAAQHGPQDAKAIGDLARGIDRWPVEVWEQATTLANDVAGIETFSAGLRLLPAGRALANELDLPRAEAVLQRIAERESQPRGVFQLRAFTDAHDIGERARVLRMSLLPRQEWIVLQYRWAHRGRPWLLAAYAVHLARSPAWAMRAWRFRRRVSRTRR